jgi:hypothetical protein
VDRVVAPGCRVHAAWPPAQLGDWQGVPTPLVSALCSGHPPCSCSFEHPAWEAADLSLFPFQTIVPNLAPAVSPLGCFINTIMNAGRKVTKSLVTAVPA